MIRWNVDRYLVRFGVTTAYQLAKATGISQPAAKRVMNGVPLERIDVPTLEALARAFRVKPLTLLRHEP